MKLKEKRDRSILKVIGIVVGVIVALIVGVIIGAVVWYNNMLSPVDKGNDNAVIVNIQEGESSVSIAQQLIDSGVIRSKQAFLIYMKFQSGDHIVQSGKHELRPNMSVKDILVRLSEAGMVDTFNVTFLPGGTLAEAKATLILLGYEEDEIDAAFSKNYDHPVLKDKPKKADLEGYLYGETYQFVVGATVEDIVLRCLDELNKAIQTDDLESKFKKQGLNLFQGIVLASIIQREVNGLEDQKQVAQVFLTRLKSHMLLGSDVTYQYIADKLGIERDYNLDNPYNTRRYPGLPPGPIAAPGLSALRALASPAKGDYLFFLSGDDDKTYFGRTNEEHQWNIDNHCKVKCSII
jgi:conserved hypothetical protein, YceG family